MDDVAPGCNSVKEGKMFYKEAKDIMLKAGFKELQEGINVEVGVGSTKGIIKSTCDEITFGKSSLSDNASKNKVLGLEWDLGTDEFIFKFDIFVKKANGLATTKRNITKIPSPLPPRGNDSLRDGKICFKMHLLLLCVT